MKFTPKRAKIPLKSNKKRRIGTISCILFCVLIWWNRRGFAKGEYTRTFRLTNKLVDLQAWYVHPHSAQCAERVQLPSQSHLLVDFSPRSPSQMTDGSLPSRLQSKIRFSRSVGSHTRSGNFLHPCSRRNVSAIID